jgi:hypothetical protein
VATDQKLSTIDREDVASGPVIENEIPTYRAISARAIFSVACGVLSVGSFAHWVFYIFSILAIGIGIWAHRKINQLPDVLTGKGLANAGIFLGLVFGLVSGTFSTVQYLVQDRQAKLFAAKYAEVIKAGDLGEMLWYNSHPDNRKGKTGAELKEEMDSKPQDKMALQRTMGPISQLLKLQERISSAPGTDVHFARVEALGEEPTHGPEVLVFAFALFQIDGPTTKKFPEPREYVLAIMKARPKGKEYEWWVESVVYPYTPQSYQPPDAPVGDGHDHAGGGH